MHCAVQCCGMVFRYCWEGGLVGREGHSPVWPFLCITPVYQPCVPGLGERDISFSATVTKGKLVLSVGVHGRVSTLDLV